jgi:hypothetical protein
MPKLVKPSMTRKYKETLAMSKDNRKDGRKNNNPPDEHKFKPGQSGNPAGRPRKKKSSFDDEIKVVFGTEREVVIDGQPQVKSLRQLILEQIGVGAAKGDAQMIKLALPFMKSMDDAPELEILPEDKKIIEDFIKQFDDDGGTER